MADALSWVTAHLGPEGVQAILDEATMGTSQRVERGTQPSLKVTSSWKRKCGLHVTDWAVAQKGDPDLNAVLQWLGSRKKADRRILLRECIMSEEGQMVWRNCQNFTSL